MRMLALLALAVTATTAAGCGLRPIYAERTGVTAELAEIRVDTGRGRVDYLLRQTLLDLFNSRANEANADYVLETTVNERRTGFGIRLDAVTTRYEIQMRVRYVLRDASDGSVVSRGVVMGEASYDTPEEPYGDIAAEERVRERAIRQAANEIELELSLFFANASRS